MVVGNFTNCLACVVEHLRNDGRPDDLIFLFCMISCKGNLILLKVLMKFSVVFE